MKIKIGIFGRYKPESANGVDRTIIGHMKQLARKGHEVSLITTQKLSEVSKLELNSMGVDLVVMPTNIFTYYLKLRNIGWNFDLCCIHSVFIPRHWLISKVLKCSYMCTPHGGYSPRQIAYKRPILKKIALLLFEIPMLKKARLVQALVRSEVEQIKQLSPTIRVGVCANGIDAAMIKREMPDYSRNQLRMLYIGRLAIHHKGLDLLFRALAKIGNKYEWSLDVVGPAEDDAQWQLTSIIKDTDAESKIIFHGRLYGREKDELLKRAHVFVHTSRYEGMPFAIIEALGANKPVIITPETNLADLVAKYNAGYIVNGDSLYEDLCKIFQESSSSMECKGHNARTLVELEFAWDKIGDELDSIICRAMAS